MRGSALGNQFSSCAFPASLGLSLFFSGSPFVDKIGLPSNQWRKKSLSPHCVPLPGLQLQGIHVQWMRNEETQLFLWPLWASSRLMGTHLGDMALSHRPRELH